MDKQRIDIKKMSDRFQVKELSEADLDQILDLCAGNKLFYEYHPPLATKESILADMAALPPCKNCRDKYYAGYYDEGFLVAIVDLILDYPEAGIAFVGFFMVDISYQGKNTGTSIIDEMVGFLREIGFKKIRLAIDKGNPQSEHFWMKNYFTRTDEKRSGPASVYIPMERWI